MSGIKKETWVNTLEQKVDQHLQEAIVHFQNMPAQVLLHPSTSGGWSMAQCLEHLNSYGRYYLKRIEEQLRQTKKEHTNEYVKGSRLGRYFTRMMDPKRSRIKFKAFKNHRPQSSLDAHAVVAEFIEQQEHLLYLLKEVKRKNADTIKISISICSWIKLPLSDVIEFLIVHNERHIQQAKRNIP